MKKFVLMFLVFSFGLFLIACDEATTGETTTEDVTTTTEDITSTTEESTTEETSSTTEESTTEETSSTTEESTTVVEDVVLSEMYEGSHVVSAMGSEVVYNYEITFDDGEYYFLSTFVMDEEIYTYEEEGIYSVSGIEITLTPEGEEAVVGEYLESGNISIPIKASEMASREDQELVEVMISRIFIGTHEVSAMGSSVTYSYQILFAFGEYVFFSEFEMAEEVYQYYEFGTYEVEGDVLTITPIGEESVVGSIDGESITIGIKPSAMASRADQTLTASPISMYYKGTHVVSAMGSEVTYEYTISFINGDYHFISKFTMGEEDYEYEEFGTYTINDNEITLSLDGSEDLIGEINQGYKITIPVKASEMGAREDRILSMFLPSEEVVTE